MGQNLKERVSEDKLLRIKYGDEIKPGYQFWIPALKRYGICRKIRHKINSENGRVDVFLGLELIDEDAKASVWIEWVNINDLGV